MVASSASATIPVAGDSQYHRYCCLRFSQATFSTLTVCLRFLKATNLPIFGA